MDELVGKGRIVEIMYSIPSMEYRLKSFLLSKRTKIYCQKEQSDVESSGQDN